LAPVVLLSVVLVATGCGGDGGDGEPTAFPTSVDPSRNTPTEVVGSVNVLLAGGYWVVGENNFVFGITDGSDLPQGGASVTATFFDLRDVENPRPVFSAEAVQSAPGVGEVVEHVHASGEPHVHGGQDDNRVGYYVRVEFTHPGTWGVSVDVTLKDGTTGTRNLAFDVLDRPLIATPGQRAPASVNLTAADVNDISQIDSGDVPNDMHDVIIKDAIDAGRPFVVVFATPAYCTSRFCGPVVEEIESLHDDYKEDVDFIHIEIWGNFAEQMLLETVKEWIQQPNGSLSEPMVYVVDKDGIIYDSWEGPIARNIVEAAVQEVASGQTYLDRVSASN
jgi:hypothetical protein